MALMLRSDYLTIICLIAGKHDELAKNAAQKRSKKALAEGTHRRGATCTFREQYEYYIVSRVVHGDR